MLNLNIPRNIVAITLPDGEIAYKQCTLEDAKKWKSEKRDFTLLDKENPLSKENLPVIASHQIYRLRKATELEEFELFVYPQLSKTAKKDFKDIKLTCEQLKQTPSLTAILAVLEKKKSERIYELTINRELTDDEKKQRKKTIQLVNQKMITIGLKPQTT